jgi:hypothetical protein
VPGGLTYSGWIDGLKKGRSVVTNGPMLGLEVDGKGPGDVIKLAGPGKLKVKGTARSQFPLAKVEVVHNGEVVALLPPGKGDLSLGVGLEKEITIDRPGWLALRASGPGRPDGPFPALFAHTGPIYVEVAGAPARSRADAKFFLSWIDDLAVMVRERDRVPSAELRQHIQNQLEAARAVYLRIAREGK